MNLSILLGVIGLPQIILILFVIILLFGGRKIPELMRGIGQGLKEFKKPLIRKQKQKKKKQTKNNYQSNSLVGAADRLIFEHTHVCLSLRITLSKAIDVCEAKHLLCTHQ